MRSVTNAGGVLTHEDLASYEIDVVEPIVHDVGGAAVLAMPPPSSGGVAIAQVLDLAERLELDMPATGWPDEQAVHLLAESLKHAFADRSRSMGDPRFTPVPIERMLAASSLERMARAIEVDRTQPTARYGSAAPISEDGGTSHISVIDRFGNAVACTETINLAYGSLVGVEGFGFCLNDQMDDFTTIPGEANAFGLVQSDANLPEPGKRPLSSMSPTIVLDADGEVIAVAGASGGPRIITATVQTLLRMLRGGATAEQAVNAPRVHHQWLPDRLDLETIVAAPVGLEEGLRAKGHQLGTRSDIGAVQAIRRDPARGVLDGAADPRKGGGVATARVPAR